jgi:hypothetical protein
MGANAACTIAEMKDGASNTIMLSEIRAGVTPLDPRGVWAMSGAGPSSTWACGYLGDSYGPNCPAIHGDDVSACSDVVAAIGSEQALQKMGMPCYPGTAGSPNRQASPRSMHVGGIFVVFADGSVHWIGDFVEISTSISYASVWDRLLLSKDGGILSAQDF